MGAALVRIEKRHDSNLEDGEVLYSIWRNGEEISGDVRERGLWSQDLKGDVLEKVNGFGE